MNEARLWKLKDWDLLDQYKRDWGLLDQYKNAMSGFFLYERDHQAKIQRQKNSNTKEFMILDGDSV